MMKPNIRYKLGRLAGQPASLPQSEAENLVSTGQAVWLEDAPAEVKTPEPVAEVAKKAAKRSTKKKAD